MLVLACAPMLGASPTRAVHIVVDTGHTPQNPGATGASGRVEYLYNLDLSAAVARDLVALNHRVTRVSADGKEIALKQRALQAPNANFFLSIHHDSIPQDWIDAGRRREFSGFSLFVSHRNPYYAQSLRCAQAIGEKLLQAGEKPSLYNAMPVLGGNMPLIDERLGIHRFDNLVVLKTATMPAVLVEAAVIANPDEEKRLGEPGAIDKLATAISQAIHDCIMNP
ncbi:MAG: N-acetylmuramoyl-L-alanine amidase [Betaproteobacteria bacterium]|nr:N-acetylmuramoyl-L-alanine amidase [Betaproteobacteria bacterium]